MNYNIYLGNVLSKLLKMKHGLIQSSSFFCKHICMNVKLIALHYKWPENLECLPVLIFHPASEEIIVKKFVSWPLTLTFLYKCFHFSLVENMNFQKRYFDDVDWGFLLLRFQLNLVVEILLLPRFYFSSTLVVITFNTRKRFWETKLLYVRIYEFSDCSS